MARLEQNQWSRVSLAVVLYKYQRGRRNTENTLQNTPPNMSTHRDATSPKRCGEQPPPYSSHDGTTSVIRSGFVLESHSRVEYGGKMHPLIAAAYHNRTKSPLCRLPDGALLRLLQLVDRVTLECLRRCSRVFLRLSPGAYSHVKDIGLSKGWKRPQPEEREGLLALLSRDEYCSDCLLARNANDWQERVRRTTQIYLHCSGCQADHPACLFSASQRRNPPAVRICIGHEGFGVFRPEDFFQHIRRLRKQGAQYICPQLSPGQMPGSRLFDPTRCDCLEYEGREQTGWPRPPTKWRERSGCRANPALGLRLRSQAEDEPKHFRRSLIYKSLQHCYVTVTQDSPDKDGRILGPVARTDVGLCNDSTDCVQIRHINTIKIEYTDGTLGPMNHGWYHSLDPRSYGLTADGDGYAVYWCKSNSCRNYHRYTKSRLSPFIKQGHYTRSCPL
ncbi:hypothetical protein RJ55_00976 [Drechmeria coniospora]|nr:hypothetical protein RJ55_00976 [Drechmeria coniospora]